MERNNTLISDLTESSKDVEVWAKVLRVWEMKSAPNEIERHLIVSDPKGCRIEMIVPNSLCQKHYFGSFNENEWKVFRRFEVRPCDGLVRNTPHQFQNMIVHRYFMVIHLDQYVFYNIMPNLRMFIVDDQTFVDYFCNY
ncbi:hypothetical protein Bca52824_023006 [Brassica carinata]|uniref:Replication protein A 70 kDa DNA-binding subunit B/D first OB fold domain-containing protein n=1 Tax=Brassica carinata TaxID=52824 RepID=A0A8X7VHR0_BRACI|nr:hypothetical protein Bca52824_023006 [Brassica carinata]